MSCSQGQRVIAGKCCWNQVRKQKDVPSSTFLRPLLLFPLSRGCHRFSSVPYAVQAPVTITCLDCTTSGLITFTCATLGKA